MARLTFADLTADPQNANRGTPAGMELLERSLRENGAGRSILTDKNGIVISGNKTVETAAGLGLRLREVATDGSELVVVRRQDLDLTNDPRAQALALLDNRVAEINLDWDPAMLALLHADHG